MATRPVPSTARYSGIRFTVRPFEITIGRLTRKPCVECGGATVANTDGIRLCVECENAR